MKFALEQSRNIYLERDMAKLSVAEKLSILADAAKYDASCASSGGKKRDSLGGAGVGSVTARASATPMRRTAAASRS